MRKVGKLWVLRQMPASLILLAQGWVGFATEAHAQASSTIMVTSQQNPCRAGDVIDFTVAVLGSGSGGHPTGTVTLDTGDGTSLFGTLSDGRVKIHHSYVVPGFFLVIGRYNGDVNNLTSESAVAQTVGKAVTTTTLGSLPNASSVDQPVTFVATVTASAGIPTGKVTYHFGDGSSASGTLVAGSATVSHTYASAGRLTVTATYHGDAADLTSVGTTEQNVENPARLTTGSLPKPLTIGSRSPSPPLAQDSPPYPGGIDSQPAASVLEPLEQPLPQSGP
jgi:hypothetical protein